MKRLVLFFQLVCISAVAFGQSIGIKTVEIKETATELLPAYDTTALYLKLKNLVDNPHYYDGQKIMILPPSEPQDNKSYYYVSGFTSQEKSYPEYADTTWFRKRKKVKEGDYQVNIPTSNVYCAKMISELPVRSYNYTVGIQQRTGLYTPASKIEGHFFTIKDVTVVRPSGSSNVREFLFEMIDEQNNPVDWQISYYISYNEDGLPPIIIYAYYEQYVQKYVGKTFIIKPDKNSYSTAKYAYKPLGKTKYKILDGELKCTEISLMAGNEIRKSIDVGSSLKFLTYLEPKLIFKDSQGEELALSTKYDYNLLGTSAGIEGVTLAYELMADNLIDLQEYNAQIEREKIEKEKKEAENARRAAEYKALVEKEKAARLEKLTKKYGAITAKDIVNGYVRIGWSKEKCIEAWGQPDDINKSTGSWGVHEQWVYGYGSYLYFENGKLTSIQN